MVECIDNPPKRSLRLVERTEPDVVKDCRWVCIQQDTAMQMKRRTLNTNNLSTTYRKTLSIRELWANSDCELERNTLGHGTNIQTPITLVLSLRLRLELSPTVNYDEPLVRWRSKEGTKVIRIALLGTSFFCSLYINPPRQVSSSNSSPSSAPNFYHHV